MGPRPEGQRAVPFILGVHLRRNRQKRGSSLTLLAARLEHEAMDYDLGQTLDVS